MDRAVFRLLWTFLHEYAMNSSTLKYARELVENNKGLLCPKLRAPSMRCIHRDWGSLHSGSGRSFYWRQHLVLTILCCWYSHIFTVWLMESWWSFPSLFLPIKNFYCYEALDWCPRCPDIYKGIKISIKTSLRIFSYYCNISIIERISNKIKIAKAKVLQEK